jgi:hypothetical protein
VTGLVIGGGGARPGKLKEHKQKFRHSHAAPMQSLVAAKEDRRAS